ncbi:hypothetical protein [Oryzicola mucosus]|uniref:Uncharacterized protein n=1 Tax=Oryzicola mucosus TaxID=2767425 RepID=A0A8J6U926_9HYPH|nr:hypothetical protein [Oryzicola mucosus]MBD0416517.1 hypothetical protein [Oryzicola mucosus]
MDIVLAEWSDEELAAELDAWADHGHSNRLLTENYSEAVAEFDRRIGTPKPAPGGFYRKLLLRNNSQAVDDLVRTHQAKREAKVIGHMLYEEVRKLVALACECGASSIDVVYESEGDVRIGIYPLAHGDKS